MSKKEIATFTCDYGNNFIYESTRKFTLDEMVGNTGGLDMRTMFYAPHIDYQGGEWYFNYLNYNSVLALKGQAGQLGNDLNKRAYAYLQLGYMPVIFLPSFCNNLYSAMLRLLENTGVPFIKTQPMSFGRNKLYNVNLVDAWVSKMDAAKFMGMKPEDIRAADFARRLLTGG